MLAGTAAIADDWRATSGTPPTLQTLFADRLILQCTPNAAGATTPPRNFEVTLVTEKARKFK
jgi:hypothetical protein